MFTEPLSEELNIEEDCYMGNPGKSNGIPLIHQRETAELLLVSDPVGKAAVTVGEPSKQSWNIYKDLHVHVFVLLFFLY